MSSLNIEGTVTGRMSSSEPLDFEVGAYYRLRRVEHWTHSLNEEFDEPLALHEGIVGCCESVERRGLLLREDLDEQTGVYVVMRYLDPRNEAKILRIGFFQTNASLGHQYTKIDEPLVVLALAGAGLAP